MSAYASTSVPKPKNWQDFEGKSCILFRCILSDPGTSSHGRGGQAQQGVDIYGRRGGQGDHWVGIQCKLKGDAEDITKSQLEIEIARAKNFSRSYQNLSSLPLRRMMLKSSKLHVRSPNNMKMTVFLRSAFGTGKPLRERLRATTRQ